jgi:hypothetical protein
VVSNPAYGLDGLRVDGALTLLKTFLGAGHHAFWRDAISITDERLFDLTRAAGHRQLTEAHATGVLALVLLAFAAALEKREFLGSMSRVIETVTYTATFFLHMIPAVNETTTRVPPGVPLASGPDDPLVLGLVGVAFVGFLIGAAVQVVRLRAPREAVRVR